MFFAKLIRGLVVSRLINKSLPCVGQKFDVAAKLLGGACCYIFGIVFFFFHENIMIKDSDFEI